MKVIFNYATRQFEPMEPSMRERFALGGGVIQGEKVGDRENFKRPILQGSSILEPSAKIRNFLKKKYPEIKFDFKKYPLYGVSASDKSLYNKVSNAVRYNFIPEFREKRLKKTRTGESPGIGQKRLSTAKKKKLFETFDNLIAGELKLGENVNFKKLSPDLKQGSLAIQTLAVNSGTMSRSSLRDLIKQHPWYKQNKDIWNYSTKVLSGDFRGKTLPELIDFAEKRIGGVKFKQGRLSALLNPADQFVMKSALRHWDAINRLQDPTATNRVQFYNKGSKKPINWNSLKVGTKGVKEIPSMEKVEFTLDGKPTRYSVSSLKTLGSDAFPEVYEKTSQKNKILNKIVTDSKGKKVQLRELVKKAGGGFTIDLDHVDGVMKNPFSNLRVLSSDLNNALSAVVNKSKGSQKYKKLLAKEILGEYSTLQGALFEDALAEGSAKKMNSIIKGDVSDLTPYQTAALSLDKKLKNQNIKLSKKDTDVLNLALKNSVISIKRRAGEEPAKKFAVKAGLKSVAKALPIIGTAIGIYDVNKALQAGITDPRDLYIAYEVSADVAAKQKAMREDPTGKLGQQEITNLPDITQELPDSDEVAGLLEESGSPYMQFLQGGGQLTPEEFNQLQSIPQSDRPLTGELDLPEMDQTMMAAQGGRVGFANGSPSPLESEATIDQALAALNSSEVRKQFFYDTSPIGKLDKDIFGKDGDRNLMQQFNTQFLDPRSYPYYAQKTLRGAANIPELSVRFPLAAAYLFGKGTLAFENFKRTGDLSKFSMEDLRTAMEILEPKFTNLALEGKLGDVLGLSPEAIQAVEEKRTGPQKTTGDLLQFTGEAVGPATPYIFLTKLFPKLPKQIKDLVGTTSAVDKVNKEIERRASQDGVDQTRRDIVLATAAGAGVGLLKYLGLDTLFKGAPKAVKAAPEIITKGGTPKYFFDFVSLIKSKGDDITDKAATLERQKVYNYNGYELTEDISTGKITIRKDTEGGGSYYVGDGEYETVDGIIRKEEINYEPPETILDDKGKPKEVPDTYDEATLLPDVDGGDGDAVAGLDSIDEILELLSKDGKSYSLKELEEMGLNVTPNSPLLKNYKPKKAGGGIIKLAGADSGPPPKSGPTPHGLPYIAKNVRPIKERK